MYLRFQINNTRQREMLPTISTIYSNNTSIHIMMNIQSFKPSSFIIFLNILLKGDFIIIDNILTHVIASSHIIHGKEKKKV